jgi:hypothetical protein
MGVGRLLESHDRRIVLEELCRRILRATKQELVLTVEYIYGNSDFKSRVFVRPR